MAIIQEFGDQTDGIRLTIDNNGTKTPSGAVDPIYPLDEAAIVFIKDISDHPILADTDVDGGVGVIGHRCLLLWFVTTPLTQLRIVGATLNALDHGHAASIFTTRILDWPHAFGDCVGMIIGHIGPPLSICNRVYLHVLPRQMLAG